MHKEELVLPHLESFHDDRDELFPVIDQDVLPIQNPLRIARPMRFGTKRENAIMAHEAVRRLLDVNSALLSYLTLKQWDEVLKAALDELKVPAFEDFTRHFNGTEEIHGVEVSTRGFGSGWTYPAEIDQLEVEVCRMQDELKRKKKAAEADGSARRFKGEGKSLVVSFRP